MLRLIVIAIILLVIDFLAFQALRQIGGNSPRWVKILWFGSYWLVPVIALVFVSGMASGWVATWPKALVTFVQATIFILYFAKLLMAVIILVDDLRRLVFSAINLSLSSASLMTKRSQWMTYSAFILGALPILSLTYGMIRNPYRYKLHRIRVPVNGLHPDLHGLRIVQISDIHSGSFLLREPVERSVQMIMEQKPDIVFFTGDLVNTLAMEMEPYIEMFNQISAPLGVYSILGNHDYGDYYHWTDQEKKKQNFDRLKAIHGELGWQLLLNEHRHIDVGNASLNVIGVENYSANPRFPKYGDLAKATAGMNSEAFNILLSHDPSHWRAQVTDGGYPQIGLTLSGHTHGFQFGVEIPGFMKWSPVQYVYEEWAGLYERAGQYLYVNRGLGFLGYPGRVGILPEITLLTLEAV
jgi:predicted MPP superfamily phosphohydrolase